MFGIQWDLVCKYLEGKDGLTKDDINNDSSSWGNCLNQTVEIDSKNTKQSEVVTGEKIPWNLTGWKVSKETRQVGSKTLLSTGASNKTSKLNIYDLVGNEWEWTLECRLKGIDSSENVCVCRGCSVMSDIDMFCSVVGYNTIDYVSPNFGFRPCLY